MNHSDFWLSDFIFDEEDINVDNIDAIETEENRSSQKYQRLIRLSSARRAVANYVSILTNKQIPVHFVDGKSCTDGETIFIGSNLDSTDHFDVGVGLALHEASHINHSDFNMYKNVWQNVPREIYDITDPLNISKKDVAEFVQCLFNYVEDRYIDWHVYTSAPGYQGYYNKLYDEYFNSSIIDKGLTSDLYRIPNIDSYSFRIINLTNTNTDLTALPGLYEIAKQINLSEISRLDTPKKRLDVAMEIAKIVFSNVTSNSQQSASTSDVVQTTSGSLGENTDSINGKPTDTGVESTSQSQTVTSDSDLGGEPTNVDTISTEENTIGKDDKFGKSKIQKLKKAIEKQKDFVNNRIVKKKVSNKDKEVLETMEKSKTELNKVGSDFIKDQLNINAHVDSIFVKNMTRELLEDENFPMTIQYYNPITKKTDINLDDKIQNAVNQGIVMGVRLGKKLKLRNEVNIDKFTRKNTGKIDKRLLHEIGSGIENIFYNNRCHKYNKTIIHISVDASSSMRGTKWLNSIKLCTTIAKAASMLENVNVSISFRTVTHNMPYTVIGYDSTKDSFSKVKNLFGYLNPAETTPEGLAFESIMSYLPKVDGDTNGYFINISDGEPCFNFKLEDSTIVAYTGVKACIHTRKQVKKILASGYKVLSYFVSEYEIETNKINFKVMYGEDSRFINVHNINSIADTLNGKLLEKD